MERSDVTGAGQVALGGYAGYKAIEHGLPRALGVRIEYHTTSKENADLIKKVGNILDPKFGGKNGWAQKVECGRYINNSKNYVHLTGIHKDSAMGAKYLNTPMQTIHRRMQCLMYKLVGNLPKDQIEDLFMGRLPKEKRQEIFKNMFSGRTKRFCVPGIDSYFNKEFVPDVDDIALKSTKPIKAFTNRFGAMVEGLKKFGLKGMKENKGRVALGLGIMALGIYFAQKYIRKGIRNIRKT